MSTALVHRPVLMTDAGVVVSGHHKASEAGAAVLRSGGNAMDAAVAASAVLCVAVPHMNGLGGDCIGLYFDASTKQTTAINGSGRTPKAASPDEIRRRGHDRMPRRGPAAISVCGLVDAWERSLSRFGTRSLGQLLSPAARLARDGCPVDSNLRAFLAGPVYAELAQSYPGLAALYGPPGLRPLGSIIRNEALAGTIDTIMQDGADTLYRGRVGDLLLSDLAASDAILSKADLSEHSTRFDRPLSVPYLGRRLHSAPPNSQGVAVAALSVLSDAAAQRLGGPQAMEPADYLRRKRVAFALRTRFAGDIERVGRPDDLLTPDGLEAIERADREGEGPTAPAAGDTSTLVVIDRWGNAVSLVQSLFEEFGSGIVSPSTGIVMHNRLALQELASDSPTPLIPGERPFHTLCPVLVENDGGCEVAIATPGDHGQPQSIHQVLTRLYAEDHDIQAAIEAPRIRHDDGREVLVEDRVPESWIEAIEASGFDITRIGPWSRLAGGVNAIQRFPSGLMHAGADPRRSCYAITAD